MLGSATMALFCFMMVRTILAKNYFVINRTITAKCHFRIKHSVILLCNTAQSPINSIITFHSSSLRYCSERWRQVSNISNQPLSFFLLASPRRKISYFPLLFFSFSHTTKQQQLGEQKTNLNNNNSNNHRQHKLRQVQQWELEWILRMRKTSVRLGSLWQLIRLCYCCIYVSFVKPWLPSEQP